MVDGAGFTVNGAGSKITSEPAPLEAVEGRYAAQVLTLFWNLRHLSQNLRHLAQNLRHPALNLRRPRPVNRKKVETVMVSTFLVV